MSKQFAKKSEYPLQWPPNIPRTTTPEKSRFDTTLFQAMDNVESELNLLAKDSDKNITNIRFSANVALGNFNPDDAGVCVYFHWNGIDTCIPVDRYTKVEDNLQAIYHIIKADRTKILHGGIAFVMAEKQGKMSLQLPDPNQRTWWETLNIDQFANPESVKKQYRKLVSIFHPDRPDGDKHTFKQIQQAYNEYKKQFKN